MTVERGNLSINSENIFPIIKKWLYSDQDIFIREMTVSYTHLDVYKRQGNDALVVPGMIGEISSPSLVMLC